MNPLQNAQIADLSYPVNAETPREMPIGPPKLYHTATMEKDGYFESRVDMSGHCSTHIDAPSLMVKGGGSAESIAVERLCGQTALMDLSHLEPGTPIDASHFDAWERAGGRIQPSRIAFIKTGMEKRFGDPIYNTLWTGLNGPAAKWLLSREIELVGTDACAIESVHGPRDNFPAHRAFLENGVPIVENLRGLDAMPDTFFAVVAPMKLENSSGAPARVFAFL